MPLHHSNHAPHSRNTSSPDPSVASFTKGGAGVNSHAPIVPRWALISSASHRVEQKEAQEKKQKL